MLVANRYFLVKLLCIAALVGVLAYYNSWASDIAKAEEEVEAITAENAKGQFPNDGVFKGSAKGHGGTIEVAVTIEGGYLTDIEVVDASREDSPYIDDALVLASRMLSKQSTDVDTITGATSSSAGVINATRQALLASLRDGA